MTNQRAALENLLGRLAEDPALDELEDRAHDGGHLDEGQYGALLAAGASADGDAALRNLKRHVLFCDVCADEFLSRSAPEAERVYRAADDVTRRRRSLLLLGLLAACVAGVVWWSPWSGRQEIRRQPEEPFLVSVRRVMVREDRQGRVVALEIEVVRAVPALHLYGFVVAGLQVRALPAMHMEGLSPGVMEMASGSDQGGGGPRDAIILLATAPVPLLEGEGVMAERALDLQRGLARGGTLEEAVALLHELRGQVDGEVFVRRIEE